MLSANRDILVIKDAFILPHSRKLSADERQSCETIPIKIINIFYFKLCIYILFLLQFRHPNEEKGLLIKKLNISQGALKIVQICECLNTCAADFSLLNLPKGKSLGRSKPATNS